MTTKREHAAAIQRMLDAIGNIPSSGDGPSSSNISRPTENAAIAHPDHDPARRDLDTYDRLRESWLRRKRDGKPTEHIEHGIALIVQRWQPLTAKQSDGLRAKGDDSGEGWCQSCWRVGSTAPPRTVGSNLCRWCEDWVRTLSDPDGEWALEVTMPPLGMVELHAQGRRIDAVLPPRRRGSLH